jgi:hypothetical protein
MRYRKKPVVVEAVQLTRAVIEAHLFDKAPLPEGVNLWNASYHAGNRTIGYARFGIKTLEGNMEASEGDWIIKGVAGEFYPCKPDIFAATYEPEQAGASEALPEPRRGDTHNDALEAARRIVALADRFAKCRAEFPIERDWDFDACSEHEEPLVDACIKHGELIARALIRALGEK